MKQSNLNIVIKGNIADKGTPRKYYILFFFKFQITLFKSPAI